MKALLVSVGVCCVLLAGCGSGDNSSSSEQDGATTTEEALPTPQEWVAGLSADEVVEVCDFLLLANSNAGKITRSSLRDSNPEVDEDAIQARSDEILTYMSDESC